MNRGKTISLSVKNFYVHTKEFLDLCPFTGKRGFAKLIVSVSETHDSPSVLFFGKRNIHSFNNLTRKKKLDRFEALLGGSVTCVVLADSFPPPPELLLKAKEKSLAVFVSKASMKDCQKAVKDFLRFSQRKELLAPGGMLQIFGLGVLIVGDSGIGKSESALELISRGHHFVSDDVTLFSLEKKGLVGSAPDFSRNFMEIRGMGIINIKEIFGPGSVCHNSKIDLVINLKRWEEGREYDRLGLEFPDSYEILGEKVSQIIIPVAPGRSIATLIEVACKVYMCREKGYHAPEELLKNLDHTMARKPEARGKE